MAKPAERWSSSATASPRMRLDKDVLATALDDDFFCVLQSADHVDNTLLAAEREYSAQALSKGMRVLREVEAARKRLRDGAYGVCLRCEEEIAPKRLQAIPWASCCVSCQAAVEEQGQSLAPNWMRAA